jgi:3-dehydroquinate synthase
MEKENQVLTLFVQPPTQQCQVCVGTDLLADKSLWNLILKDKKSVLVCESRFRDELSQFRQVHNIADSSTFFLEGGEQTKTAAVLQELWNFYQRQNLDRSSLVVALGGGALCDVVGFSASTFHRGVPVVLIPSTLLGMADAAIGGKTAVNLEHVKNSVGTFWLPSYVLCDLSLLRSLPAREFRAGLAEIIKIACCCDVVMAEQLCASAVTPEHSNLHKLLAAAIQHKISIVQQDFAETGLRRVLNFGHTVGHALEAVSNQTANPLLHGEAVALGMLIETSIALSKGFCEEACFAQLNLMLHRQQLPTKLGYTLDAQSLWRLIALDKKKSRGEVLWALPTQIGAVNFDSRVEFSEFQRAMTSFLVTE